MSEIGMHRDGQWDRAVLSNESRFCLGWQQLKNKKNPQSPAQSAELHVAQTVGVNYFRETQGRPRVYTGHNECTAVRTGDP